MASLLPPGLAAEIESVRADRRSGAMALARRLVTAIMRASSELDSTDVLEHAIRAILQAQPAMAPMLHLAGRIRNSGPSPERIARACRELLHQVEVSDAAIADHALALLEPASKVLTHSFSGTVAAVLSAGHRAGRVARVMCTESRPLCEGTDLARWLAVRGMPVDLVIDAAAPGLLYESSLVLLGADAVAEHGVVNKTGTYPIALAAAARRVPVWIVSSTLKVVPEGFSLTVEPPRPASEIAAEIPGCRIRNLYFETTPFDLVTGIITEGGRAVIRDKSLVYLTE